MRSNVRKWTKIDKIFIPGFCNSRVLPFLLLGQKDGHRTVSTIARRGRFPKLLVFDSLTVQDQEPKKHR
eukprot:2285521-Amphidinium_carterae.1